jgi:hypothetical protein
MSTEDMVSPDEKIMKKISDFILRSLCSYAYSSDKTGCTEIMKKSIHKAHSFIMVGNAHYAPIIVPSSELHTTNMNTNYPFDSSILIENNKIKYTLTCLKCGVLIATDIIKLVLKGILKKNTSRKFGIFTLDDDLTFYSDDGKSYNFILYCYGFDPVKQSDSLYYTTPSSAFCSIPNISNILDGVYYADINKIPVNKGTPLSEKLRFAEMLNNKPIRPPIKPINIFSNDSVMKLVVNDLITKEMININKLTNKKVNSHVLIDNRNKESYNIVKINKKIKNHMYKNKLDARVMKITRKIKKLYYEDNIDYSNIDYGDINNDDITAIDKGDVNYGDFDYSTID